MHYHLSPIGHISTPFKQKFGIPRQSVALSKASGTIYFEDSVQAAQACTGLDAFSHLWLLFVFHENLQSQYKPMIRPPRLGGNKKIGVFASRSSFRPNNIGMSLVKNEGFSDNCLRVSGIDLLDQTPIIDVKPYLPYADCIDEAQAGYAQEPPRTTLKIIYSDLAQKKLAILAKHYPDLDALIKNVLGFDPRPSYKQNKEDDKSYRFSLYNVEIDWLVIKDEAIVVDINDNNKK